MVRRRRPLGARGGRVGAARGREGECASAPAAVAVALPLPAPARSCDSGIGFRDRATKGSGQRHSCMPDICRCQLRILTTLKNGGNGNTIRAAFENQTAKTGPLWLRRNAQFYTEGRRDH
ncbi:hypothetical protein R6Z07F_005965 [Ovis aries]